MKQNEMIFGLHAIEEAFAAGKEIERIVLKRGVGAVGVTLRQLAHTHGVPVQTAPEEKFTALAPNRNHQGAVAFLSAVTYYELEEMVRRAFESGAAPLFIALEGVTDTRNVGAVARSAVAFGAHGMVTAARHTARLGGDAVKTSAGALLYLPVHRTMRLGQAFRYLKNCGVGLVALSEKADESLYDLDLTAPLCLLLGAEDTGIDPGLLAICDVTASIPLRGAVSSLNVSVAAGVALAEVMRQRQVEESVD